MLRTQARAAPPLRRARAPPAPPRRPASHFEHAEMDEINARMADQHRHVDGPWPKMLAKVASLGLGPGSVLLDLASGPGEQAAAIARQLPSVKVVSTDVSAEMVAQAAVKAAALPNMTAAAADAQDLSAFGTGSVDVVTCCYGYMFPQDKARALAETHRVLKPGGKLVATYWISTDILNIGADVMHAVLGRPPDPPAADPLSLAEPGLFDGLLHEAGFHAIEAVQSKYPWDLGSNPNFQYTIGTILFKQRLDELDAHATAWAAFHENIGKYTHSDADGNMMLPGNVFVMVTASK